MNTAQPIRNQKELVCFKSYYEEIKPHPRNQLLIVLGLNTALRVSDLISIHWKDVYNFDENKVLKHLNLIEKKTGKKTCIYLNQNITAALLHYQKYLIDGKQLIKPDDYLFQSPVNPENSLTRIQVFRIIKKAAEYYQLEGTISCHSLRKTFGYHAWKQGISPVMLVDIYNHSSFEVTKRYLGIEQDDRDFVFQNIRL